MKNRTPGWLVFSFLFLGFSNPHLSSQELTAGGTLYGTNWSCLVKAPEGWSMDSTSLAPYKIYALFYEDGKRLQRGTPIVYITTTTLDEGTDNQLQAYIQWDLNNYLRGGSKVTKVQETHDHFQELNETYTIDEPTGQYEKVVYTRFKDCGVLVVLSTRDSELREQLEGKLEEVINNMFFVDKTGD